MTAPSALLHGERYELLGEVASGGMATVYLARMRRPMGFSRLVAIKCMHPQFAKDPDFVSMFMDEARLTARLRHPNVVPTMDIVAEEGHLLLVMEYVEGASLATLLKAARAAGTTIPLPMACAIVHDMLLGLHEAHQAKDDEGVPLSIIHRDVSPQNVLVGVDGLSRVLDFGVAKARQNTHRSNDNEIKGKIPYMPPEQLFGEALDHRVDVYAAGVTLWEALCCERLFDGPSETALVRQISEEPIRKPSLVVKDLPAAVDALVLKALAREAKDRFESALAMAEAIASVVQLPNRTEVSNWVRQYVTPKDVPSERSRPQLAAEALDENQATALIGILERASMKSPSQRRAVPGTFAMTPVPAPRPTSNRTTRIAIGVAAAALLVAGVAIAKVARSESQPTVREVHVVAPQATQLADSTPVTPAAPSKEEAPTASPQGELSRLAAPVAPPPTPVAPLARTSIAKAASPRGVVAAPKVDTCRVPYTIDAAGQKHYKAECL